jgi:hypothetical protein
MKARNAGFGAFERSEVGLDVFGGRAANAIGASNVPLVLSRSLNDQWPDPIKLRD